MNAEEIILKKNQKKELSYEELSFIFNNYLNDKITDEVMTKMLQAICKNDMTDNEIYSLTDIFIKSGDTLNLPFRCIDKHSTGGVGDKTTLILIPILASLDIKVAKMSGRALGYTGGTIDKLESIPGFKTKLSEKDFIKEINDINVAITSQTANLCPMDKNIYALRDVTNTTKSVALIASSIMSKKIASGASYILIDLKVGKGALISNLKDAKRLAKIMINIGKKYGRKVECMLTRMNNPLGDNIGNSIEIKEVIDILKGKENELSHLVIEMASQIIKNEKKLGLDKARNLVNKQINTLKAYDKFIELIKYQGGSISLLNNEKGRNIYSIKNGYISSIDAKSIGEFSMHLGAGRIKKQDTIDYDAGIIINKNVGEKVKKGDILCTIYGKDIDINPLYKCFNITIIKPIKKDIIIKVIS